jgi:hypothetical protein
MTRFILCAAFLAATAGSATAQNVINSNTTIRSALCVGADCLDSESYGNDTIRLKGVRNRIHADDTSGTSFPNRDWRLIFNDSTGSASTRDYFGVQDAETNNLILRLQADAPDNALVVDSAGEMGLGTLLPFQDIHIKVGDSPTIRLDQDGSGTFAAQSWDIGGNEQSFFVRDVTNGSTLPFRVKPGAPSGSIFIDPEGDVSFGINGNTTSSLHLRRTDGTANVLIEEVNSTVLNRGLLTLRNNGGVFMALENTDSGVNWNFQNNSSDFRITTPPGGPGEIEFRLNTAGDLFISGDLTTGGAGACNAGCDRVFDADYDLPSIDEQRDMMFAQRHLPNVGPTPEGDAINVTQKVGGLINELEKAHIYIAELHDRLNLLEARLAAMPE